MIIQNNEVPANHPFERSLGMGPYTFVGMFSIHIGDATAARPGTSINGFMHPKFVRGAGTCAHCGMAIMHVYQVEIGNGEVYGIGSDCILKAGMAVKELTKVEKIKKAHEKALRQARKAKKGDKARQELSDIIDKFHFKMKDLPHPAMLHRSDLTLADYADYVLKHSNDGGIVFALVRIKNAMKGII